MQVIVCVVMVVSVKDTLRTDGQRIKRCLYQQHKADCNTTHVIDLLESTFHFDTLYQSNNDVDRDVMLCRVALDAASRTPLTRCVT